MSDEAADRCNRLHVNFMWCRKCGGGTSGLYHCHRCQVTWCEGCGEKHVRKESPLRDA